MSEEGVWIHQFINVAVKLYGSKNQVYACSNTSHNTSYNRQSEYQSEIPVSLVVIVCRRPLQPLPLDRRPEQPLLMYTAPSSRY